MTSSAVSSSPDQPGEQRNHLITLGLLSFFLFLYLLTYSGLPHNPDDWFYLAGAQAAIDGDLAGVQAHGWLFSLMAAPFYALSITLPQVGAFQAALLLNIPITALTAALLHLCLGELGSGRRLRLAVALIYGVGSLAWPYSRYLFREPAAALFLLAALWATMRFVHRPRLAALLAIGASLLCAALVKQTTLALLPFYAGALIASFIGQRSAPVRERLAGLRSASWPAGLALAASVVLLVALTTWLAPLLPGLLPKYLRLGPDLLAFAALWISPGWGLLAFAPALIISALGANALLRRHPAVAWIVVGGSLFYTLAASAHRLWWGYWAFGPRQVTPLIPLLCLPLPDGLRWLRERWGAAGVGLALLLIIASILIQILGVIAPFNSYVRDVLFPANIAGPDVAWNWRLWPLAGMLRFVTPARFDVAWITGRASAAIGLHWSIVAPLLLVTLLALLWLAHLAARRRPTPRRAAWLSLLPTLAWLPAALLALQGAYLDERYEPQLGYPAAAQVIQVERRPGDVLITDLWTDNLTGPVVAMINYCHARCPTRIDLAREALVNDQEGWQARYQEQLAPFERAWLVLERVAEGDPNSIVEQWLGQIGYLERCQWTGPQIRLCRYSLEPGQPLPTSAGAILGDQIELRQAQVSVAAPASTSAITPGSTLQIELTWQALQVIAEDYVVSVQLLAPDSLLAASTDRRPGNGFQPTTTWRPGQSIVDRYALTAPAELLPGSYRLIVLMYSPLTGERLPVRTANGSTDAAALLLQLMVP